MRNLPVTPMGFSRSKILASVALAIMLGACSNAVERFAENPSNSDPVYTASVPKKKKMGYEDTSDEAIVSRPLSNATVNPPRYSYNSQTYKKPTYKPSAYDAEAPVADESADNQTAYVKPKYRKPVYDTTADAAPAASGSVRVGQGMTLYSIAKANGLTVAQLASANHISPPYSVSSGRVLRIPGVAHAMLPRRVMSQANIASSEDVTPLSPRAKKLSPAGTHTVASGETLFSLGRKYGVSPYTIADMNGLSHSKALSMGQSLRVPAGNNAAMADNAGDEPNQPQMASNEYQPKIIDRPKNLAASQSLAAEEIPVATPAASSPSQPSAQLNAAPIGGAMRWPVKGKVISEYGAKPNGLKNEGINIAVPEGTGIRAAESGVVAYAGNELKGYGNLVLVRHEGGWVTAYAHASELFVKRGDTVKRGDVIAKAGQTGSVSSPQLHFEVRKGATAMDPLKFLSSATASN